MGTKNGYIDSDSVIVALQGKLLPDLIEELGNEAFLDLEARVISSITAQRCVISTGGSAIYREDVIKKMKENGVVIYLKISFEEVEKRLGNLKERGVVLKKGFTLRDLYEERDPLYEKSVDIVVELDGSSIEKNAEKLIREVKEIIQE